METVTGTCQPDTLTPRDHTHPAWRVLLAIVGPMLPAPRTVEPGTLLADLGLDDLDRDVIAMELGDAMGLHIGDDDARRWLTMADVLLSAGTPPEQAKTLPEQGR